MKHPTPRYLHVVLTTLLVVAAFLIGNQLGSQHALRPVWASMVTPGPIATLDTSVTLRPIELFRQALVNVESVYVEPVKNTDALTYAAIRGMLAELKDPYTRFMDPKEYQEFTSDNAGHFAGIGATLHMTEIQAPTAKEGGGTTPPVVCPVCGTTISADKHYRVTIADTLPNSPAKAAGLLADDAIMKVDSKPTDGLTVSEVADQIRGPEGTKVTLTIARKGEDKLQDIEITRAQIEVPAVESRILDNQIGYLRMFSFNDKTYPEMRAALEEFNKNHVRGLVLDLRNNPGGLLSECIKVTSLLLPADNKVIVSTQDRNGEKEDFGRVEKQLWSQPMVVLVNKGSASASEILTGALKDYNRATVIGESTFGKALVQTILRLSDGSAMAVTTAHYYTPSGHDVGKVGVSPNITVALDKDTKVLNEKDNQALEAIRILREKMAQADTQAKD